MENRPLMAVQPDENRCQVCGWPLADTWEKGCVPGNCSMRPRPSPTYAEQQREYANRKPYEQVEGERNKSIEEAALLRQALMNIRKDAYFAHRTIDSPGEWEALCEDIMRQVDEVTPNNTLAAHLLNQLHHAADVIRDLQGIMQPVNEYVAKLEEAADLAVRGFRRWKHNQGRRGDRHEAEHGMTDLGQGISDLDELLPGPR